MLPRILLKWRDDLRVVRGSGPRGGGPSRDGFSKFSRAFLFLFCTAGFVRAAEPPRPALVVVIAVDQFRGDYLDRFGAHFAPGGLRLLMEQGANFVDCRYRHAVTKTSCGHAVILTGVHANVHGIINNNWTERATMKRGNCVDDDSVQILGRAEETGPRLPGGNYAAGGVSPRRMLATTIGDELRMSGNGRSKVIGISSKDRSAVLLAGKLATAAYWMDKGRLVTSTHYMKELPAWVKTFNDSGRIDAYFGKTWDRILPAKAYEDLLGPDDVPGESAEWGLARTFPKVVNGGSDKIGPVFYDAFECSPFKSEVLADFAREVVEHEQLGQRGVTDMLCVSFSVNDTIGHNYGPDSHEVMDITLRTDRLIADFLAFLDARVGLKKCTVVFTADHGTAPIPEQVAARGANFSAGRVDNVRMLKTCEAALDRAFGRLEEGKHWLVIDETQLLFFHDVLEARNVSAAAAEKIVRDALLTLDFVEDAFTRTELEAGVAHGQYAAATVLSFNAQRSGDLYYQVKPFWVDRKSGTNHGSPYNYDTHVPLLWFGVGVKPGRHTERVGVDDLAPTLAHLLGVNAPPMSQGRVLF